MPQHVTRGGRGGRAEPVDLTGFGGPAPPVRRAIIPPEADGDADMFRDLGAEIDGDLAEVEAVAEQAIERFYRTGARTEAYVPHNRRLHAEVVHPTMYQNLSQVHLLQTDNNVQPVMGAVHIVRPPAMPHDKHFMVDMEGDINEGQQVLKAKGRRGPAP